MPGLKRILVLIPILFSFLIVKIAAQNPTDFVVSDSFIDEKTRSLMNECYTKDGSNDCYKQVAEELLRQFQIQKIVNSLERAEKYPEVFSRCHEVTHYVGRALYEQNASVPEAYHVCNSVCHGGCYHGVIEAYFKEKDLVDINPENEILRQEVLRVCGKENDYSKPLLYYECIHGIGHAMMFITYSDLLQSLKMCDFLRYAPEREACYSGVFMENSSSSTNLDHPSQYLNPKDSLYPCNILEKKYLKLCYQYQSSYFAQLTGGNWEEVIKLCKKIPEEYQEGCFLLIGTNQVGYTQNQALRKRNCELIEEQKYKNACVAGVITSLGGRYVGDYSQMIEFCSLLGTEEKLACYNQMGSTIRGWGIGREEIDLICNDIDIKEKPYVTWCE